MNLDTIKDPTLRRRIENALAGAEQLKQDLQISRSDKKPKRIRQKTKGPNQLELSAMEHLKEKWPWMLFRFHALTFVLANGVKYTPDIIGFNKNPHITTLSCVEVKGKQMWDDAVVKVKVAAHEWPNANWGLMWKENGEWQQQIVLP